MSNKKISASSFKEIDVNKISAKCGKPLCGVWFSPPFIDNTFESEWHYYTEYNMLDPKNVKNLYITEKNKTFVTTLTLKKNTKMLTISQIENLFNKNASKQQIINELGLSGVNNLVLSINTKEDLKIITKKYLNWNDVPRKERSELWKYVATNFVGCNFSENLFKEVSRSENDLISSLDTPSFVAFSSNGFNFKTKEKKLKFAALEKNDFEFEPIF